MNSTLRVAFAAAVLLGAAPAFAQGISTHTSRVFEHENETPAAQKDAREAARNGQPDNVPNKPGGAYPTSDSASSSGAPPKTR